MAMSKRCVIDTNVLVSALLFSESKPARVVFALLNTGTLLTSLEALQELETVLHRSKFDHYVTFEEREVFITKFALAAFLVDTVETIQVCRDPKDDKFLEIAVNGAADMLITGDPDLLVLHPFRGVAIITPDAALTEFDSVI